MLAYLRDPANAAKLGIDPLRIVLAGHSMGGWVVAHTASKDPGLLGAILISAADMGREADQPRDRAVAMMADDMEALAGVTAESMADEVRANAKSFRLENTIPGLVSMPLLVITSNDGLAPAANVLVAAIAAKGGKQIASKHFATDHSYSDHRIALESAIITWLGGLH